MRKLILTLAFVLPTLVLSACATSSSEYDKSGFATAVIDGRLWVFQVPSKEYNDYKATGMEPGKFATAIGAGPDGMTVMAPDAKILNAYLEK
jgi:hypothetical protein